MIPMFSSYIEIGAIEQVAKVLNSGFLSEGVVVKRFERKFEKIFGLSGFCFVSTNSGTSALHLALETLGVGGKVLLPANTFVATGLAVLMAGCTPVFCDILPDGTIDPEDVRRKIDPYVGAVIGVDWAGKRCSHELEKVCAEAKVTLIIDAAQSLGRRIGPWVDAVCYSFQATKHLTTGDGGGIYFPDYENAQEARKLRWFGIGKDSEVGILGEREYELTQVGYKYHMNDYTAALGLANLESIEKRLNWHRQIADIYLNTLDQKVVIPVHEDLSDNVFWAFPIITCDLDVVRFSKYCRENEIPCSIIHRGIDHNPVFGGPYRNLTRQREWERRVTHLPVHVRMSWHDAFEICKKVNQYE